MKKFYLFIILLQAVFVQANTTVLQQLSSVNIQWQNQKDISSVLTETSIAPNINHIDLIALHLQLVEKTLRNRSVEYLSTAQKANRTNLLNKLHAYWQAKQFPINDYLTYKSPVFIDRFGTHCAVGYLMQQSGYESLAREIDSKQKFAFVHDIKVQGVNEWATNQGFTIDELAWIQPGYWVTNTANALLGGVNGQVNSILVEQSGAAIYVAGQFNMADGTVAANNIAVYQSGFGGWFWMPLSNGVNGKIKSMIVHNNQLIVGGSFTQADGLTANHVAIYDLASGQWQSMGFLDGTVNTFAVFNNEIYAGGSFTSLLSKWTGNSWVDVNQGYLYGAEVRTLEVINAELIVGGDFELATGALRKNVCRYDGTQFINLGFGTVTPVNDLALYNGRIYAACDVVSGNDTCALALFNNLDWEKVIVPINNFGGSFSGTKISTLAVNGTEMICGGNFMVGSGLFFGQNIMRFEQGSTALPYDYTISPILFLDSTVNTIAMNFSLVYFGGDFVNNNVSNVLNHVAYFDVLTGIKQLTNQKGNEIKVYPNPSNNYFIVSADKNFDDKANIVLTNSLGQEVLHTSISSAVNQQIIDASKLTVGIYNLTVYNGSNIFYQKIVVNP